MTVNLITATFDHTIREICKIMHEHNVGSIVILKDKILDEDNNTEYSKPIGIVTEKDIVSHLGSKRLLSLQSPICEIMSRPVITIHSNSSIRDAIETMQLRNIRRLLVIDTRNTEKIIGIITERDIFRAIIKYASIPSFDRGILKDQMPLGYRFMYERLINEHMSNNTTQDTE